MGTMRKEAAYYFCGWRTIFNAICARRRSRIRIGCCERVWKIASDTSCSSCEPACSTIPRRLHSLVVPARNPDRLHEEVPDRQGHGQGDLRDRPGRGRDCGDRHGDRRRLGRRAGDDLHLGPRHLADERVRRPRRTSPRCPASCSTSSAWGRPPACRRAPRRATCSTAAMLSHGDTQADHADPGSVEECYTMAMDAFDLAERFQTLGVRDERPRPRHEHLDVAAVRVSREAARSRQGARRGRR